VAELDAEHWVHAPGADTDVHITLHMSEVLGRLGHVARRLDHDDETEEPDRQLMDESAIPDLLLHAARYANNRVPPLRLQALVEGRIEELDTRFRARKADGG
jgi:hypothetical protein